MNVLAVLDAYGTRDDQLWYVAHPVHPTEEEVVAARAREDEAFAYMRAPAMGRSSSSGFVVERRKSDRELRETIVRDNIWNAKQWLAWLIRRFPTITFIAPWIATLDGGGDDDLVPEQRARGLRDCRRTIRVCSGMVLVGGRVSAGMLDESDHARTGIDLTFLGRSPPVKIMTDIVDQPPPVSRPDLVPIWEQVIADVVAIYPSPGVDDSSVAAQVIGDMRARDRVGRERYGMPLTTGNGRDHLVDLYQELLDATAYAKAEVLKHGTDEVGSLYYRLLSNLMVVRIMLNHRAARKTT